MLTMDIMKHMSKEEEDEEEVEDTENEKSESVMSRQEFCECVSKLKRYASVHGHAGILNKLVDIDDIMTGDYIRCKSGVQTKINDFFKK